MTICPPFMYYNTANWSPFSDGPFIVASTRSPVERVKKTGRPGSKREAYMVSWRKKGEYKPQISPKSESCGFKWANTHNKCVHDPMSLANVTTDPCLMWPHYIPYLIKLRTKLLRSLRLL